MGATEEQFWKMTQRSLEAFIEADSLKRKRKDKEMWVMGNYVRIGVSVALENGFSKTPKAKYLDKPFSEMQEEERELTQEELDEQIRKAVEMEDRWVKKLEKNDRLRKLE